MLSLLFGNSNVMAWHGNGTPRTNSTLLITAQPVQNLFETPVYNGVELA